MGKTQSVNWLDDLGLIPSMVREFSSRRGVGVKQSEREANHWIPPWPRSRMSAALGSLPTHILCFTSKFHRLKILLLVRSVVSNAEVTYSYMCEVSLVVALALLQQCNSTTSRFLSYATMKTDASTQQWKQTLPRNNVNGDVTVKMAMWW
jgi:hypothetical protein